MILTQLRLFYNVNKTLYLCDDNKFKILLHVQHMYSELLRHKTFKSGVAGLTIRKYRVLALPHSPS